MIPLFREHSGCGTHPPAHGDVLSLISHCSGSKERIARQGAARAPAGRLPTCSPARLPARSALPCNGLTSPNPTGAGRRRPSQAQAAVPEHSIRQRLWSRPHPGAGRRRVTLSQGESAVTVLQPTHRPATCAPGCPRRHCTDAPPRTPCAAASSSHSPKPSSASALAGRVAQSGGGYLCPSRQPPSCPHQLPTLPQELSLSTGSRQWADALGQGVWTLSLIFCQGDTWRLADHGGAAAPRVCLFHASHPPAQAPHPRGHRPPAWEPHPCLGTAPAWAPHPPRHPTRLGQPALRPHPPPSKARAGWPTASHHSPPTHWAFLLPLPGAMCPSSWDL